MKRPQRVTCFDADEAFTLIAFLDPLQALLCNAYQVAIAQRKDQKQGLSASPLDPDFEDRNPL